MIEVAAVYLEASHRSGEIRFPLRIESGEALMELFRDET
jgi:hypothetical protein